MKQTWLIICCLLGACVLGAILRFYQLGEAPAGFYIDEAGQGYSAYSILQTGKDEFGKEWPIVFRSFTDFKTPIYTYFIAPLIPVFGLTTLTVRLPSAIFGVLTLPVLFLLITTLSKNNKLALLATLLLAISPWHILFSRTDYECNIALFFYLLGVYLFYSSFKNPWKCVLAAIFLAISAISYQSERIIVPLTVIALFLRYKNELLSKKHFKQLIIGSILAILIVLPTLSISATPGFLARASGLNIFSTSRQLPAGTTLNYDGMFSGIINSSWFLSTKEFTALYFSYFSPRFMFDLGDYGPRSSYPDLATFFVWQFPFYLIGLVILIKKKSLFPELSFFTILLLLLSPIPAAVTRDPYTSIRALPLVIPQVVLISLGLIYIYDNLGKKIKLIGIGVMGVLVCYSILHLYSSVIVLNEFYRAIEWDYGLKEVSQFIENKYQTTPVIFDNSRDEMYIQLAFFLKYDPEKFQLENFEVTPDDYYTNMNRVQEKHIGQITTRPINWQIDLRIDQFLIGDELAISHDQIKSHHLTLEKEIKYPDGSVAFRIVRTNPDYENNQAAN